MEYLLYCGVLIIAYTDLKYFLIPNIVIFPMYGTALLYSYIQGGWQGLLISIAASLFYFFFGCFFYIIGGLGGGDVKYLAVLAAWLGFVQTWWIITIASVIGFFWSLIKYKKLGILRKRLKLTLRALYLKTLGTKGPVGYQYEKLSNSKDIPATALPYGTCLCMAVLILQIERWSYIVF